MKKNIITEKSWTNRYKTSRTTKDTWVDQKKLLVARNMEQYQEICPEIPEMSTEESSTYEKDRKTLPIGKIS